MNTFMKFLLASVLLVVPIAAFAQSTVLDQAPVPLNTAGNTELFIQSYAVSGGTLYESILRQGGLGGPIVGVAQSFAPVGATSPQRYLKLTDAKSDLGVPMTAAAGTPSGTVGISRTAGTSMLLVGEVTSSNAKTDKAVFETNLADTYIAGANIPVTVNCDYAGSGTVTAASTTMTVAAYTEINGVETALTVSAAQQIPALASVADLTFTITGTGLVPGSHVVIELTMLVTTASGANTGQINSVAYKG